MFLEIGIRRSKLFRSSRRIRRRSGGHRSDGFFES